jgi:hypothetical protein
MMQQIPGFLGREATEILTSLDEWARGLPRCPFCKVLRGCSHVGRCPLGRAKRLKVGSADNLTAIVVRFGTTPGICAPGRRAG